MEHKVVLTTPETVADTVDHKVVRLEMDVNTGSMEIHFQKVDNSDNVMGAGRFTLATVSSSVIETFLNAVITEAQAQGEMGAGSISQS